MADKGFYDCDLHIKLDSVVNLYESERERYWTDTLGEEEYARASIMFEQAEAFAKALFTSAETLIAPDQIQRNLRHLEQELRRVSRFPGYFKKCAERIWSSDKTPKEKQRRLLELCQEQPTAPQDEASPLKLVWERLLIDLSWQAVGRIEEAAKRMLRLYELVLRTKPSQATQKFLGRLGRCYVWGFDSECIILCRAVLDTAFRDIVPAEVCERHCRGDASHGYTLSNRMHAALKEGYIDGSVKRLATQVKVRGDSAVHYQPDVTQDILGTIRDTVVVLEKLHCRK